MKWKSTLLMLLVLALPQGALAQGVDYPAPKEGVYVAKSFTFHTGEVLPELKLAYVTIGEPSGDPVVVLHGTAGSAKGLLSPAFAGELFGPGKALDAKKHFVIIPDAIGAGGSSKPSDGMKGRFPRYNYADMVRGQHLVVTEGLGVKRLRLVIGNSMGGMHTWMWGVMYPDMMDALAPMASQPTEMSSRNWMMRRLIIDSIRNDPAWKGGDYVEQPQAFRAAAVFYAIGTNGGTLAFQKMAPTREAADKLLDQRLAAAPKGDANDYLYQWDSSRDYNPAPELGKLKAALLVINSADDERNPPETGLMVRELARIKGARLHLILASAETRGHGTTGFARFWAKELQAFLAGVPRHAP